MQNLEYFVGKACTIITANIPHHFNESQFSNYYVGIVEKISSTELWTKHPLTKCKNYFPMREVISIFEEQMLFDEKPEDAEMIKKLKEKYSSSQQFVDIDKMNELIEKST